MNNTVIRTLFSIIVSWPLIAAAPAEAQPRLKSKVDVMGELVTVGDLVADAGPFANRAIFRAPDLGKSGTVSAAAVTAAVEAVGLDNLDTDGVNAVLVSRPAKLIDREQIEQVLRTEVAARLGVEANEDLTIRLDRTVSPLFARADSLAPATVTHFTFSASSGRFQAIVRVDAGAENDVNLRLSGQAVETLEIQVLDRRITRGEILTASDLTSLRVARRKVTAEAVFDPSELIGMQATRTLPVRAALRKKDFARPLMVKRGDLINLSFRGPGITLSIRGRALSQGAQGDAISVLNLQSNRVVNAVISGAKQAIVTPPVGQIAQIVEN